LRETWLKAVALRYGQATSLLDSLGLFDAYHAPWFLALLVAFLLNTLICTVQDLPRLWRTLSRPPAVFRPPAFYQSAALCAEWAVPSFQEGLAAVREPLLRHRYRVQIERDDGTGLANVYAERGRWSRGATVAGHLAAVALVVAIAARPALSWQDDRVALLPGEVYHAGHSTELAVRAGRAVTEEGARGYQAPLAILVGGEPAITETVALNEPLAFAGVSFHLQGYGPAARITAPEGTFGVAFVGNQAQVVTLSGADVTLQVAYHPEGQTLFVEALAPDGGLLGSGRVAHGQQVEIGGVPIVFHLTQFTVWQVSRDPTFGLAVVSAGLFLAAATVSLWVPHRRLWLRLDGETAQMAGSGDWGGAFDMLANEMDRVVSPGEERDG
jgi:cytochrome c biogenesis protein